MKITINPLLATENDSHEILLKDFIEQQGMLSRIKSALNKKKIILDSIDRVIKKKNHSDFELASLVDELDKVSGGSTANGTPFFDGSFSRMNPRASMWFAAGLWMYQRERIFLKTMTSGSLRIKTGNKITATSDVIQYAQSDINKYMADIDAYSNRVGFVSCLQKDLPPAVYHKIRLERNVKKHQIEFLQTAQKNISSTNAILKRLKELEIYIMMIIAPIMKENLEKEKKERNTSFPGISMN